jgi:hypothetical protein
MPEENEKAEDVAHRRSQLEIDKLDKENRKLDLEITKLKSERTVWVALTSQLATITALVVSIISATMSFYNAQTESKKANEQTIQDDAKLFNDLLDRANNADSNASTGRRIASLWSLLPYWNTSHDAVLANALASIIIYDKDKGVLDNAAEVLGGAYDRYTPDSVPEGLRHMLFGKAPKDIGATSGKALGDIGVVLRAQQYIMANHAAKQSAEKQNDLYQERILAIGEVVRKGWKDLKRANLQGAILPFVDLYEARMDDASFACGDLHGANFSDASLNGADFRGANLIDADFTGAKIEGAQFEGAFIRADALSKVNGKPKSQPLVASSPEAWQSCPTPTPWFAR